LVERRSYRTLGCFYINRYLRLYPIYGVVTVATLALLFAAEALHYQRPSVEFFAVYQAAPPAADALLLVSNIFLFGQDWVMFSAVEHHSLVFSTDFTKSEIPLWEGLIAPQAWTLGIELTFYLVAPFILTRRAAMYTVLILSIALRAYLVYIGLGRRDPWSYRFFPTELALFLSGALAHQILLPWYRRILKDRISIAANIGTYALVAMSFCYFLVPIKEAYKEAALFGSFILVLPLTFIFQNRYSRDSMIGDLSYPIYIGHMLAIWVTSAALDVIRNGTHLDSPLLFASCCVTASLVFALVLNSYIAAPFERVRARFRSQSSPALDRQES
jgi:peptidoglycan/LPS O-acetylase OafA/YrhL